MHRRSWLASIVALVAMSLGVSFASAQQPITLADRLNAGLKCRRPEEFAFVEAVVLLVDQKKLTTELVLGTYRWAAEQRPDFPFYYFQYGLRRRAAAIGVTV
ncbi:hypothetical protein [Anatilimnocola aggregata]|nr:hypothetical protein [Anatilimnocola aggregata]